MDSATIADARRIFDSDVVGVDEASAALGVDVLAACSSTERQAVVRLPFGRDRLMRAADDGMMLVLRLPRTLDGRPLTIVELGARFPGDAERATSAAAPWYARESFASEETCRLGWALVEKRPFPQSRNLNYPEQSDELDKRSRLFGIGLRRRTAVEIVYDTLLFASARGERLLPSEWDWSSSTTSDGAFVTVGEFDERGLRLLAYSQAVRFDSLGVCATFDADS